MPVTDSMHITVNGESRQIAAKSSLHDLLQSLDIDPRTVVVEHNRAIVRRPQLAEQPLQEGDSIELVHFVGGG